MHVSGGQIVGGVVSQVFAEDFSILQLQLLPLAHRISVKLDLASSMKMKYLSQIVSCVSSN